MVRVRDGAMKLDAAGYRIKMIVGMAFMLI